MCAHLTTEHPIVGSLRDRLPVAGREADTSVSASRSWRRDSANGDWADGSAGAADSRRPEPVPCTVRGAGRRWAERVETASVAGAAVAPSARRERCRGGDAPTAPLAAGARRGRRTGGPASSSESLHESLDEPDSRRGRLTAGSWAERAGSSSSESLDESLDELASMAGVSSGKSRSMSARWRSRRASLIRRRSDPHARLRSCAFLLVRWGGYPPIFAMERRGYAATSTSATCMK